MLNFYKNWVPKELKKSLFFLLFLMVLGMFFEMFGLGLLVPVLTILIDPSTAKDLVGTNLNFAFLNLKNHSSLVLFGLITLVAFYIIKSIFLLFLSWRQSLFSSKLLQYLNHKLFEGYMYMPFELHLNYNSSLIMRNMNEANNIMTLSLAMMSLIVEFTAVVGISILLFLIEPIGMLFVVVILILIGYLFQKFLKSKLELWGSIRQNLLGVMNLQISQGLGGIKKIILKNRQMFFINKYNIANKENVNIQTKINTLIQFPRLFLELLAVIGLVGLLITMEAQGKKATFIISTLGIFVAASFRLIPSLNRIMTNLQTIQFLKPSITFINSELDKFKQIELGKTVKHKFNSLVKFDNVSFKYLGSDNFVLKGISFDITKGQTIGIIGTSGSGKSTLVDLLLGLLVPTEGAIFIDGIPINQILYSWQKSVGYVSQDIYLMDDTLINNIAFGIDEKTIDYTMINKVIDDSQLSEFVSEQEFGLNTNVGERGVKLSGGQKQRIGIARALYNDPEILVLDEATSALDIQTELDFINTLNRIRGEKTIIIIAHRLSTLKSCDYIIKLKNGRIIEKGLPRDIIKTV